MRSRLHAAWLLFWALVRTLARRLLTPSRKAGLAAFRANYAADGLTPVTASEREAIAGFAGCVACGLCDRGEGERIARSRGSYRGVMTLVLAASRSMPDYAAAARGFAHVPDEALAEKERICPTGVPMRAIAAFVRNKASSARVSLPPASGDRAQPSAPSAPATAGGAGL